LRQQWLALAAAERVPVLAPYRGFGALLSYGPNFDAKLASLGDAAPVWLPVAPPSLDVHVAV